VLLIEKDQRVPADLVLLRTSEKSGKQIAANSYNRLVNGRKYVHSFICFTRGWLSLKSATVDR